MKQFCRNIKNLYVIIRYFGFSYLDSIYYNYKQNKDVYMVALRDGEKLIGYYEKHEFRNREKDMKMYDLN